MDEVLIEVSNDNGDHNYQGNMSEGQKELYDLLLAVQITNDTAFIIFESLSRELKIKEYQAIEKRLENL
ncbi:hypothetical protein Lepto7375DRAFT_7211 [Leptolyngbya sp. PCC 7375]|nr:hypothetical protein Lepto7375DRAFT_7211 [Leptolyngbya sp. PCC 7375]